MIFLEPYKKYFTISGRATRREYWTFGFFLSAITPIVLASDIFLFPDTELGKGWIYPIFVAFFVAIPTLTVSVRRLHDIDKSGWWLLVSFVPLIGGLLVIYFVSLDSTPGDNRFGMQPQRIYSPRSFVSQLVFWFVGLLLVATLWLIVGSGYLGNRPVLGDFSSNGAALNINEDSQLEDRNGAGLNINEDPQLEDRSGVMYLPNYEEPYTGQYVSWYADGQKAMEGTYKEGEHDGLWRTWDEHGQNMLDGNYKGGKKDGLWTDWLERKEGAYKGGEKDGLWTWWDEQGNITQQITYKDGEEVL